MAIKRTWTIEMHWRCKHCQCVNPGMSGKERESLRCVTCGAEKSTEPWIMPDSPETAPALTGKLDAMARKGPNWRCAYCKAESRAGHPLCEHCGAPRDPALHGAAAAGLAERERMKAQKLAPEKAPAPVPEPPVTPVEVREAPSAPPAPVRSARPSLDDDDFLPMKPQRTWLVPCAVALFVVGVIALLAWIFADHDTTARVATMHWRRQATLMERHDKQGEGWRQSAPGDVYEWTACETRQSGTEDCHPHDCNCHEVSEECNCTGGDSYDCNCRTTCSSNGNGSASCSESCDTCRTPRSCSTCSHTECDTCYDQCPVYAAWCRYRYHEWDAIETRETHGDGPGAVWPELAAQGALQRVDREASYLVRYDDTRSDRQWRREEPAERYEALHVGDVWTVRYDHAGGFRRLAPVRTPEQSR